jgi:Rrf2 family protein
MIRLSRRCRYAIAAVTYLAKHAGNDPLMAGALAEACDLPEAYLSKVLQRLVRAGVVTSRRGRQGGYVLRKPAARTTLLEIIEAMECPARQWQRIDRHVAPTPQIRQRVAASFHDAAKHMEAVFSRVSVKQLIADKRVTSRTAAK